MPDHAEPVIDIISDEEEEEEATWEREDELKSAHPHLFSSSSESRGRDSV